MKNPMALEEPKHQQTRIHYGVALQYRPRHPHLFLVALLAAPLCLALIVTARAWRWQPLGALSLLPIMVVITTLVVLCRPSPPLLDMQQKPPPLADTFGHIRQTQESKH